jgi:hypothetical protein
MGILSGFNGLVVKWVIDRCVVWELDSEYLRRFGTRCWSWKAEMI